MPQAPLIVLSKDNVDYDWFFSLKDKHKGEEAWLFGKGPSFSKYKTLKPEGLISTINEACYEVDNVDYAFTWYADKKNIKPKTGELIDGTKGEITRDFREYSPDKNPIFMLHGTGELATSFLIWMGVSRINLVGMDGIGKYSKEFDWVSDVNMEYANRRRLEINKRIMKMMEMSGVKFINHSIYNNLLQQ